MKKDSVVMTKVRPPIEDEVSICASTLRPTVPALEALLYKPIPILNHGFIYPIDYMGDDTAIVQAARVSYGRGTKKLQEDIGLLRYMMKHAHHTPFEMCEIKFHMKLPIFSARQFIRHRTASVNEYSARYSILDKEFYIPEPEHLAAQSTSNRQGRGDVLQGNEAASVLTILRDDAERNYSHYLTMLNEGETANPDYDGLARELARMNLTLNTYTQWYWKVDLRNLFGFLKLRADSHAQYEVRVYAAEMLKICQAWVPLATQAFVDYQHQAVTLSRMEVSMLKHLFLLPGVWDSFVDACGDGTADAMAAIYGMSKREMMEFMQRFVPPVTSA
jgi:thymidylate synthase (FAD)